MLSIINKNKHLSYNIFNYENKTPNGYQIKILDDKAVLNVKNTLQKEKCIFKKIKLINSFYKNLLKETKECDKDTKIKYYYIEPSEYKIIDNKIIILTSMENISESEFPQISEYDREEEKYIEVYVFDKFNIQLEKQDNIILNVVITNNNIENKELEFINKILSF